MTSTEYLLPQLPFGGAEITIVRWLKRAGELVFAGEPLLVVVNDRVEAALPATSAGILDRVLAVEGAAVAAGAPVAIITVKELAAIEAAPSDRQVALVHISPVARNIAKLSSVDITKLPGTGISGRIVKSDVLAALVAQTPTEALPSVAPFVHQLPTPNSYILTAIEVDLEHVATSIAEHGPSFARRRLELSYLVCVALAAVAALPDHPLLNSYWADTMIVVRRRVHLAIVPCAGAPIRCICDAQDLNLRGLARGLGGAATAPSSLDHTFTIADMGDHVWGDPAAWKGGGTLTQGRAAALGLGAVSTRALVIDAGGVERLAVRHAALLTLAYDARVLDQAYADGFLRDLKRRLELLFAPCDK